MIDRAHYFFVFILIVFFKTETLFSDNDLFNVNNFIFNFFNETLLHKISKLKFENVLINLYNLLISLIIFVLNFILLYGFLEFLEYVWILGRVPGIFLSQEF